jgi:hypothetical protein
MSAEAVPLREGFVVNEPPPPQPQPPLRPQVNIEPPPLERPLDEHDALRKEIAARPNPFPLTVHLLYKPITNNKGEQINKITFREPTARDINNTGNPARVLWNDEIVVDELKMTWIMAALSGILPPLLMEMHPRDWNSCAMRLRDFFLHDNRAW